MDKGGLLTRETQRALEGSGPCTVVPSSNNSKPFGLGAVTAVHPPFGLSRVSCICPRCHLVATGWTDMSSSIVTA